MIGVALLSALLQLSSVEFPVAQADGTVTLTLAAPSASSVRLWGDWQSGEEGEPMRRLNDGTWTLTERGLAPGAHLYAFIVDGLRVADPANRRIKNGFPGISSIVDIPDPSLASLPAGVVHVHAYTNRETGRSRTFHVYTPAGYSARSRLPVLFMLHGSTDSDRDWLELGLAAPLLERAVRAASAQPMLLVMLDGHPYPSLDVKTRRQNLDLLEREVVDVVVPLIEREYHPATGATRRAVIGASMGGAQALHLAARVPSLFGTVVALSAPPDIPEGETLTAAWSARPVSTPAPSVLLLCGADDPFIAEAHQAVAQLKAVGVDAEWTETPGAHNWATWREHLRRVLPRLFR